MMNEAAYAEANRTYWTHRAPSYGDVNRKELATAQRRIWTQTLDVRIQARFPDRARSSIRVLDVGTGPGFFAVILNALGYAVTAVDYTDAMLNEARLNAGEAAEHIHFHCMDAEKLGFADASFDVVVSRNLTWNLPHPERAYAEWARVLKPNGLLLNFDANWYRYLYDASAQAAHLEDRANVYASGAEDDTTLFSVRFPCASRAMKTSGKKFGLRMSASTTLRHRCFWCRQSRLLRLRRDRGETLCVFSPAAADPHSFRHYVFVLCDDASGRQ